MAKFVILGIEGDPSVWLADLEAGTVNKLDAAAIDAAGAAEAGFVSVAIKARGYGYTLVKGVDLAVATDTRSDAAAQHMSTNP